MLDYRCIAIYGWKISGTKNVTNFIHELEDIDENYFDSTFYQSLMIEDTMSGNYVYFGARLVYFDPTEDDNEVIINDELINKVTSKWNKFLEENPDYKKVINKWIGDDKPQLYVFNHIW
jgi:hypothetical protein